MRRARGCSGRAQSSSARTSARTRRRRGPSAGGGQPAHPSPPALGPGLRLTEAVNIVAVALAALRYDLERLATTRTLALGRSSARRRDAVDSTSDGRDPARRRCALGASRAVQHASLGEEHHEKRSRRGRTRCRDGPCWLWRLGRVSTAPRSPGCTGTTATRSCADGRHNPRRPGDARSSSSPSRRSRPMQRQRSWLRGTWPTAVRFEEGLNQCKKAVAANPDFAFGHTSWGA